MVVCCVPFCKSVKGRTTGISYHEFPVTEELRLAWLRAISRQNFTVNGNSNTSVVCSLHFQTKDYVSGYKIRRLIPGTIPSVFPGYPSYKLSNAPTPRRIIKKTSTENTRKRIIKRTSSENTPKRQWTEVLADHSSKLNIQANIDFINSTNLTNACTSEPASANLVPSKSVQTQEDFPLKIQQAQRNNNILRTNLWRVNNKLQELQEKLDEKSAALAYFKTSEHHKALQNILNEATEIPESKSANFLLEQILNFKKKVPRYNSDNIKMCVLWQYISPKGYRFARREKLLRLPSKSTLKRFIGDTSTETGITDLIKERLTQEASVLKPAEKFATLIIDEMDIKPQLQFDKKLDTFFGEPDVKKHVNALEPHSEQSGSSTKPKVVVLANRLLCFMLAGLSSRYKIPSAFFFSKQLTGVDLYNLTKSVLKQVEECGFIVVRIVTDNHSVNVSLFKRLSGGSISHIAQHPFDDSRHIFLSFDQNHLIKKLWTLLLEKNMTDGQEDINGRFVKMLYEIQVSDKCPIKSVRSLTRKHVDPTNFEKMNVERAVRFFSKPVLASLKYLKEHPHRHNEAAYFSDAGATIKFMEYVQQWYSIHNVSDRTHHVYSRDSDKMQFFEVTDTRLEWLENTFLPYFATLHSACKENSKQFLTKETYEAIVLTTNSNIACIKYLLANGFHFVLTRSFNSDPVESFFGALRLMSGCNDMLDSRAVVFSMDRIVKTGIISAPSTINVPSDPTSRAVDIWNTKSFCRNSLSCEEAPSLPEDVLDILKKLEIVPENQPTTMKLASVAFVAGFVLRVVDEQLACFSCQEKISQPPCQSPLLDLIFHQDNGSLRYPKPAFVHILAIVLDFVEKSVPLLGNINLQKRLKDLIIPKLALCPVLTCDQDPSHSGQIGNIICIKFIPPLLKNIANNVSEQMQRHKYFNNKPINRKMYRIH